MAKINVITPNNLGKTVQRGALDPKKWDVKFDPTHFEFVEGKGLHLKDSVLKPLKDADIVSGSIIGSNLELNKVDGNKVLIPVGNLVPAVKADKFLKGVTYNEVSKKLVFTVGNDTDNTTQTYEVSVADLLPIVVGNGLEGNGTTTNPAKVKISANGGLKVDATGISIDKNQLSNYVDGSTITVNREGKLQGSAQSSGLDCEAIEQLPIKPWKKDTVVLAKQDGQCIRLKPNGDIFTDIVAELASSKHSIELPKNQTETVNLVATVTNAGTNPTGEVFITLVKPQLGTYQLGTPTTNNIGEVKTEDLTWKIPSMASGKSLVITIPVTLSTVGSFSFGLQATSTIDTNTTNNTKTFTFSVTSKNEGTNTNYVPTGTDCPLIIATDLTHNQRLNVYTTGTNEHFANFGKYMNVFADGRGFAGKQIKLEGASTVVVTSQMYTNTSVFNSQSQQESSTAYGSIINSVAKYISNSAQFSSAFSKAEKLVVASAQFIQGKNWLDKTNTSPIGLRNMGTFDPNTQIFTFHSTLPLPTKHNSFNEAPYHCVIWCRPAGKDCKWQGIPIVLGLKTEFNFKERYSFTKIKGDVTDEFSSEPQSNRIYEPDTVKLANFVGGDKPNDLIAVRNSLADPDNESAITHKVTVVSGQEAQFTLRATGRTNNLPSYIATGKTRTSYDASTKTLTVTVSADATPTDSIYWEDLKVIVK